MLRLGSKILRAARMFLSRLRETVLNEKLTFAICVVYIVYVTVCLTNFKFVWFGNTDGSTNQANELVYIYLDPSSKLSAEMKNGQETFIERRCPVTNCFVVSNQSLVLDIRAYDAILFGPDFDHRPQSLKAFFWTLRSPRQKYVFVSNESSSSFPITDERYDNFFNWTWTYKLTSDIYFGSIIIKNKRGDVIGPKLVIPWLHPLKMVQIDRVFMKKLESKSKAAAWIDFNCKGISDRGALEIKIKRFLFRYKMTLDIFGNCGNNHIPVDNMTVFLRTLERDYYFYLAFENSSREDYVTEQVLHALQHTTVPVVLGGANYSRFLPPDSYLNAQNSTAISLVKKMVKIIKTKGYSKYFSWTNHYSYHHVQESPETDVFCQFCKQIHEATSVVKKRNYTSFRKWWNN